MDGPQEPCIWCILTRGYGLLEQDRMWGKVCLTNYIYTLLLATCSAIKKRGGDVYMLLVLV